MKNLSEKRVRLGGHLFFSFFMFFCFFVVLVSFFLLSFTFVKFLRRHIVIFILKFILYTSVLCLLYVYIENKIKIINLKNKKIKKMVKKGYWGNEGFWFAWDRIKTDSIPKFPVWVKEFRHFHYFTKFRSLANSRVLISNMTIVFKNSTPQIPK